jgi:hypothetical protein
LKRALAASLTIALLAAALWLGRGRTPSTSFTSAADTPEACIDRMFAAAAGGDVAAYLHCFAGPERDRLERELAGQPREVFERSLREAVAPLKGRAVFRNDPADQAAEQASYTIDRIYENRTERQTFQLVCQSGVWRISSVQAADAFQPEKAYGTPVFEETPAETEEGDAVTE